MTPELERMAKLLDAGVTPPEDACRELAAHLRRLAALERENERLARENREMWHVLSLIADDFAGPPEGVWVQRVAREALEAGDA